MSKTDKSRTSSIIILPWRVESCLVLGNSEWAGDAAFYYKAFGTLWLKIKIYF